MKHFLATLSLLVLAAPMAGAQTNPDVFVFEPGTKIHADEMNSNFQLLRNELGRAFDGLTLTQEDLARIEARIDEASGIEGPEGPVGPQGDPGESLLFTWDGTRLGVRLESESAYTFVDLVGRTGPVGPVGPAGATGDAGPTGPAGEAGVGLQFDWDGTRLGVKRADDDAFAYSDLRGPRGETGERGLPGDAGATGDAGVGLEFTWDGTSLGVKREDGTVFSFQDLRGPTGAQGEAGEQGIQGAAGADGVDLEFSWDGTRLGVKRADEADFHYADLEGETGPAGAKGEPGDAGAAGVGLQFAWDGTRLGVKREDQGTFEYRDLQGPKGDTGEAGSGGGLSGYEIVLGNQVSHPSPQASEVELTSTATCPAGKMVISGGHRSEAGLVVYGAVADSYPSAPNAWTVRIGVWDDITFRAYAICIDAV